MRGLFSAQIPNDDSQKAKAALANHNKILQILLCGCGNNDNEDEQKEKQSMVFDKNIKEQARFDAYWKLFNVPKVDPMELAESDEQILAKFDAKNIKVSTKKMIISILSHIECRDLIQSKMFFDTLSNLNLSEIDPDKYSFDEFGQHVFNSFDAIPNDLNILLKQIRFKNGRRKNGEKCWNVLRAMCCVAIFCHSNKLWQSNVHWFGDDQLKQIFNDPESVLLHVLKIMLPDMRREYSKYLEQLQFTRCVEIHSNPILPDGIDAWGNLPELRCAWTKCGKVFRNRDQLLNHVRTYLPHKLLSGFHVKCGKVLRTNPNMSLEEFKQRMYVVFGQSVSSGVKDKQLACYYEQFRPIFKKEYMKDESGWRTSDPEPGIFSRSNPYYFDKLVRVSRRRY